MVILTICIIFMCRGVPSGPHIPLGGAWRARKSFWRQRKARREQEDKNFHFWQKGFWRDFEDSNFYPFWVIWTCGRKWKLVELIKSNFGREKKGIKRGIRWRKHLDTIPSSYTPSFIYILFHLHFTLITIPLMGISVKLLHEHISLHIYHLLAHFLSFYQHIPSSTSHFSLFSLLGRKLPSHFTTISSISMASSSSFFLQFITSMSS